MEKILLKDRRYERFSPSPNTGYGPGLTVTLVLPVSQRKIEGIRALICTGAETTMIYRRDVFIDLGTEVVRDPESGAILVGVEVEGQVYYASCRYEDHPYPGTEQMLIGLDLLSNWLVTLNGRRQLLSLTHLGP